MPARRATAAAAPRPDRKSAILLAAEKLFAQHGYDAVSLRQIAEEAGVPLALVGYYYGQKHELFEAIFALASFDPWQTIGALLAGYDWPQMLIGLVFAVLVIFVASLYRRRVIKG